MIDVCAAGGASDAPTESVPPPTPGDSREQVRRRRRDLEQLGEEIARLSAHIQAATSRLLEMIRAFDAAEGWHEQGFTSCAAWLSWKTGVGPGAAREKVRVARALGDLPELSAALRTGELSYSVARAVTRVATPENELELVETARHTTAADMERLVGAWRASDRAQERARERERHAGRALWLFPEKDGSWAIRGRLDPEVGAVVRKALEAAGEALYRKAGDDAETEAASETTADEADPAPTTAEARRADAIGLVAEAALAADLDAGAGGDGEAEAGNEADGESEQEGDAPVVGRAERFQVVVHVSAETLVKGDNEDGASERAAVGEDGEGDGAAVGDAPEAGDSGVGRPAAPPDAPRIAHGPYVSAETARRLACDAGVVAMVHDADGRVLDIGRRRRTVSAALRRALDHRDGGCRFPGCLARFCDAHHVVPWAEGGETALDNLVLLCRRHHRRVHEDGWELELGEDGQLAVRRPDGWHLPPLPERPPAPFHPVRVFEREHRGLGIDGSTPTPEWDGHPLDVDWALGLLGIGETAGDDVSAETDRPRLSSNPHLPAVWTPLPRCDVPPEPGEWREI